MWVTEVTETQRPEGINSADRLGLFGLDVLRLTNQNNRRLVRRSFSSSTQVVSSWTKAKNYSKVWTVGRVLEYCCRHLPFDQHLRVYQSIPQVIQINHDWNCHD